MSSRILIIASEAPGVVMSGPAIRAWHLAHALATELSVMLAVPAPATLSSDAVRIVGYERQNGEALRACAAEAGVLVCAGFLLYRYPFLSQLPRPLVIDLYDPFVLENLEIHSVKPLTEQAGIHRINLSVLNEQLARGDFFICASETQRDLWLGMLLANGRINPHTMGADRTLRQLIDVVPFGIPDEPPTRRRSPLKGAYPGIAAADKVVYWGGGMWEWFDPLTAIRAIAEIATRRSDVKLFFAGVRHPNPEVPSVRMVEAAQRLSQELGLTGRYVFFNDWVPYAERGDYLLDADVALSLHFDHVETRFAYRTRLLDYIWAGLPMVVTRGDTLGGLAEARGLARTVAPQDMGGVAEALLALLAEGRAGYTDRAQTLVEDLRWSKVVAPLLEFCRRPHHAADHLKTTAVPRLTPALLVKAWQSLRQRGLGGMLRDVRVYLNVR